MHGIGRCGVMRWFEPSYFNNNRERRYTIDTHGLEIDGRRGWEGREGWRDMHGYGYLMARDQR